GQGSAERPEPSKVCHKALLRGAFGRTWHRAPLRHHGTLVHVGQLSKATMTGTVSPRDARRRPTSAMIQPIAATYRTLVVLHKGGTRGQAGRVSRFLPGLRQLLGYRREWLGPDVVAGVSVAAVAIPTAIAYAQLIGFEPIRGVCADILPLVACAPF